MLEIISSFFRTVEIKQSIESKALKYFLRYFHEDLQWFGVYMMIYMYT